MNWVQLLSSIPKGYNDTQDQRLGQGLKQQEYDTNNRQAPLKDEYLRAQIAHLRQPNQALQQQNAEAQGNMLLMKLLASGQTTPVPQPPQQGGGPSPFSGAATPQPGPSPAGPGAGVSLPPGFQASPGGGGGLPAAALPQSAGGIGMPGSPPQQPLPGPIAGSGPVPQPPQPGGGLPQGGGLTQGMDQKSMLKQILNGPGDPRAKSAAFIQLQTIQQQEMAAQIKALTLENNMFKSAETSRYHNRSLDVREEQGDKNRENTRRNTDVSTYGRASTRSQGEEAIQKYGTPPASAGKVDNPFTGVPKKDALESVAQAEQFFAAGEKTEKEFTTRSGRKFRYFVEDDEPHAEPVE